MPTYIGQLSALQAAGTVAFGDFLSQLVSNPVLLITVLLTLGVIFVNGWTDAPNAIATCVSTRCMGARAAILMAAVFNFLGVLVMTLINANVAMTIYNMVDFGGEAHNALVALCAALVAIVLWAVAAWYFGIPTSESHALIAGISGAAIALQGGIRGINGGEWIKVIYGLVLSTFLGFFSGWAVAKLTVLLCRDKDRQKTNRFLSGGADLPAAPPWPSCTAPRTARNSWACSCWEFFWLTVRADVTDFSLPVWLMILCSLVMAVGTSIGGYRIIKAVGMDMVKLEKYQGFSADLAAAGCLLLSSLTGLPVSTTHTKTTAIMGVGAAKRLSTVNWGVVKEMVLTWVLTFPGCGLIGFLMAWLFMKIF